VQIRLPVAHPKQNELHSRQNSVGKRNTTEIISIVDQLAENSIDLTSSQIR
jgi:hypothetical protein